MGPSSIATFLVHATLENTERDGRNCFTLANFSFAMKLSKTFLLKDVRNSMKGIMVDVLYAYIYIFFLILSQTSPGFHMSVEQVFENTVGKGEIACNEQFLLLPQCFQPFWRTFCHFHQM